MFHLSHYIESFLQILTDWFVEKTRYIVLILFLMHRFETNFRKRCRYFWAQLYGVCYVSSKEEKNCRISEAFPNSNPFGSWSRFFTAAFLFWWWPSTLEHSVLLLTESGSGEPIKQRTAENVHKYKGVPNLYDVLI